MKKRGFALVMAFVLAMALTGCSASREKHSDPVETDHAADAGDNGHDSVDDKDGIGGTADGNDAMQGGGAGGTNDLDNDGLPDGAGDQDRDNHDGGDVIDDIGDAAGDLARGAGDVVRDAGDAVGDAADDVGRAVR